MYERVRGVEQAVAAYKENPTPKTVTGLWQEFWEEAGGRVGLELTVEDFPGAAEDLAEHLAAGDMPIYVPIELASHRERHLLRQIWPEMRVNTDDVSNLDTRSGWRFVEASLNSPHRNTTGWRLTGVLTESGRHGMNLTEYMIAAEISKQLTGHYLDERSWSRLPGSFQFGFVVSAHFNPNPYGDLIVGHGWMEEVSRRDLGGRSSVGVV